MKNIETELLFVLKVIYLFV